MTTPTPAGPATAAEARRLLAAAIIELETHASVKRSHIAGYLADHGIDSEPADGSTSGLKAVVTERDPQVPLGVKFADLNAAAQARYRALELQNVLRQAYVYLQTGVTMKTWTVEQVTPHLRALGLPEPSQLTVIEHATVFDENGREHYLGTIKVPEEMSEEDAAARLRTISHGPTARRLVLEAFDNALEESLPPEIGEFKHEVKVTWPDSTTITVPGAEEEEHASE